MQPNKIHLFSTATPIQPGVLTIVDLGDTSGAFSPFTLAPVTVAGWPDEDKVRPAKCGPVAPVVDLQSLQSKKGEFYTRYSGNIDCRHLPEGVPRGEKTLKFADGQQTE